MTRPFSSFFRYRFCRTRNAFSDSFGSGSRATTSRALESATLISSMGRPSPGGTERYARQAVRPSLGGAAKGATAHSPFCTTYVTSNLPRCYHVCYHTDLLHKNVPGGRLKLLPSIGAITGRGGARRARDTSSREYRRQAQFPPWRDFSRRMRARSPRAGSETSFRSSRGRGRLHGKGRGDQAAGFPDRPSTPQRGVDNRRAPAAPRAPRAR